MEISSIPCMSHWLLLWISSNHILFVSNEFLVLAVYVLCALCIDWNMTAKSQNNFYSSSYKRLINPIINLVTHNNTLGLDMLYIRDCLHDIIIMLLVAVKY
jgi:hypothetical protein